MLVPGGTRRRPAAGSGESGALQGADPRAPVWPQAGLPLPGCVAVSCRPVWIRPAGPARANPRAVVLGLYTVALQGWVWLCLSPSLIQSNHPAFLGHCLQQRSPAGLKKRGLGRADKGAPPMSG